MNTQEKQARIMEVSAVVDALKEGGFKVKAYSGRGMMGARCLGVALDDFGELMGVAAALMDAGMISDYVSSLGKHARWDSLGHQRIIYWPLLDVDGVELED